MIFTWNEHKAEENIKCGLPTEVTLKVLLSHETPKKSLFSGIFSIAIGDKPCHI